MLFCLHHSDIPNDFYCSVRNCCYSTFHQRLFVVSVNNKTINFYHCTTSYSIANSSDLLTMKYYLNFIFIILFTQLLVVQTKDSVLKTFYQKLWNRRNQTKVLYTSRFSIKSKSSVFHSDTFYDRFYSKAQTLRSATVIPTFHTINKRDTYHTSTCSPYICK
jgi:hypothetical protein